MKKKKKKIETVRLITFDQVVIDVVGGTVSTRREILENFIVANNEMMTVVGGNSLSRLGKNLAAESYVLRINRGKEAPKYSILHHIGTSKATNSEQLHML